MLFHRLFVSIIRNYSNGSCDRVRADLIGRVVVDGDRAGRDSRVLHQAEASRRKDPSVNLARQTHTRVSIIII